jgi:hypothetical protein
MSTRVQRLAVRVRWLDRYRHLLSVLAAAVFAPLAIGHLDAALGSDWPFAAAATFTFLLGVIVWWCAEVVLAWLAALWETEYDQLVRDRGLPRAIALRK